MTELRTSKVSQQDNNEIRITCCHLHKSQNRNKNSAIAHMAAQSCAIRIVTVQRRHLNYRHKSYIAKIGSLGYISVADSMGLTSSTVV